MSDDGAHFGYSAEAGMKAAIGGEEPERLETVGEARARILAAQPEMTYDGSATYMARKILEAFMADPRLAQVPTEGQYAYLDADGNAMTGPNRFGGAFTKVADGLYDILKPMLSDEDREFFAGLTGFQWGWAVNAARRCVELPAVPNPAIV